MNTPTQKRQKRANLHFNDTLKLCAEFVTYTRTNTELHMELGVDVLVEIFMVCILDLEELPPLLTLCVEDEEAVNIPQMVAQWRLEIGK